MLGRCVQSAYAYAVPARHRALLGAWTVGRCDRGSRCARQAAEIIKLLLGLIEQQRQRQQRQRQQRLGQARAAAAAAAAADDNKDNDNDNDGDYEAMMARGVDERCVALLDEPDRFLTLRRTTALALATLQEALAHAQQDSMPHEADRMAIVVRHLERLERIVVTRFDGCYCHDPAHKRPHHTAAEERALLTHLGRGVELAALIASQAAAAAASSSPGPKKANAAAAGGVNCGTWPRTKA